MSMLFRYIRPVFRRICFMAMTMAQRDSHSDHAAACKRFHGVKGYLEMKNDVIICGSPHQAKQHTIFFGGDVQDYIENMVKYNEKYKAWDLERTAQLIYAQFQDSAIFVIKPASMFLNTFSLYQNFLLFDDEGRPHFSNDSRAFLHLKALYDNAMDLASESDSCVTKSNDEVADNCAANIPVKLIGFSKGCVVLNQLVYGLKHALDCKPLKPFLDQVVALYWLDGGHTGGSKAYITDDETLQTLAAWERDLFVNVTPYQVNDPMRKWIGREEKECVTKLRDLKAKITENRYFMKVPASIEKHFEILKSIN